MNNEETDGLQIEHTYQSPTPYQTARRRRRRTDPFPSSSRERDQESESRKTMSGILWPFIKGKNGCIYKVVDLINARDRTLITTYHEIMGQQSFLVAPWEPIETVKEGTSLGGLGNDSPDSGYGEAWGSGSDGDDA
ncbi:hypothetical protein E2P81_ATG00793 [Venturia nashicola]|uniref:Uncharacterized protein n=1 Tax=Venturia nashicola TaxID=86259 RepID=A0A4Z1PAB3_9PEZI|nr:hypothetical protein E6O75_ATG00811 [Venturia nashicola]TLD38250.1 hypothetical protein E2P81_ATG00793 [Venturia nashicola]